MLPDDQTLLLLSIVLIPVRRRRRSPLGCRHHPAGDVYALWLLPTQTVSYTVAYEASEGRLFTQAQARIACFAFVAVTLAGPCWSSHIGAGST